MNNLWKSPAWYMAKDTKRLSHYRPHVMAERGTLRRIINIEMKELWKRILHYILDRCGFHLFKISNALDDKKATSEPPTPELQEELQAAIQALLATSRTTTPETKARQRRYGKRKSLAEWRDPVALATPILDPLTRAKFVQNRSAGMNRLAGELLEMIDANLDSLADRLALRLVCRQVMIMLPKFVSLELKWYWKDAMRIKRILNQDNFQEMCKLERAGKLIVILNDGYWWIKKVKLYSCACCKSAHPADMFITDQLTKDPEQRVCLVNHPFQICSHIYVRHAEIYQRLTTVDVRDPETSKTCTIECHGHPPINGKRARVLQMDDGDRAVFSSGYKYAFPDQLLSQESTEDAKVKVVDDLTCLIRHGPICEHIATTPREEIANWVDQIEKRTKTDDSKVVEESDEIQSGWARLQFDCDQGCQSTSFSTGLQFRFCANTTDRENASCQICHDFNKAWRVHETNEITITATWVWPAMEKVPGLNWLSVVKRASPMGYEKCHDGCDIQTFWWPWNGSGRSPIR
ncbi:hypothetical protein BT63DRAFT_454364 [Microthyrium microscopicum]|uniref:Uncharacterized protein n=1 Tax=Microthyrium microscopicum TaxID=703497 RepID=A0A6A6UDE8_9PEZI|nr:hypothetical protein BT63DRAFT_454364 [Microthyrium microscopicum]